MSAALKEFLEHSLPLPEVAACCARLPDRAYLSYCYGDWFTTAQVEQVVGRLSVAADSLSYHGIQPLRLCWTFESMRLHLALRPDGACLAIFVANQPGPADDAVVSVLNQFIQMAAL